MKYIAMFIGSLITLLFLSGCSDKTGTDELPPGVIGWKDHQITSICLELNLNTPQLTVDHSNELISALKTMFELVAISTVDGLPNCEAQLTIDLFSESYVETYTHGIGECHSGAYATGTVALSAEGFNNITHRIEANQDPPVWMGEMQCVRNAKDSELLKQIEAQAIFNGLDFIWGPRLVIEGWSGEVMIKDGHLLKYYEDATQAALEQSGIKAVPLLIEVLEGKRRVAADPYSRIQTIENITHEDFGDDVNKWRKWLKDQE